MKQKKGMIEAHLFRETPEGIEFLVLKRSKEEIFPDIWQMVTGSINEGEKAYETAMREIVEETMLKPLRLWVVPNINSFYSTKTDSVLLIPVFAALVRNDMNPVISNEHSEFKWVTKQEAASLFAWPGQVKSLDIIEEYFTGKQHFFELVEINLT